MSVSPPTDLTMATMYHLSGSLPLQSWSRGGPTLYALTVGDAGVGTQTPGEGAQSPGTVATLAGPAVDAAGLTDGWPPVAQDAARELFARATPRRAGQVIVVIVAREGNTLHCTLVNIPGIKPEECLRRARHKSPGRQIDGRRPARSCRVSAASIA